MHTISEIDDNGVLTYKFKIMLKARAKQSVRFARYGFAYQSKKVRENETVLKEIFSSLWKKEKLDGPIRVSCYFYFKKFKKSTRDLHPVYYNSRPDLDNVAKSILDGAKDIIFHDDDQICQLFLFKYFSDIDHMVIQVSKLT